MKAILGLGTNIGDRIANLNDAVTALSKLPKTKILKISNVYNSKPWGFAEQKDFLNICVLIDTEFSPNALLGMCLGIESTLGRIRLFKNGPRVIDIDLLLYEDFFFETEELTIPHKFIRQRSFVLIPLNDICEKNNFYGYDFSQAYINCDKTELNITNYEIQYK